MVWSVLGPGRCRNIGGPAWLDLGRVNRGYLEQILKERKKRSVESVIPPIGLVEIAHLAFLFDLYNHATGE